MNITFNGIHNIRGHIVYDPEFAGQLRQLNFDVSGEHWNKFKNALKKVKNNFADTDNAKDIEFSSYEDVDGSIFELNRKPLELTRENLPIFSAMAQIINHIKNMPEYLLTTSMEFIESNNFERYMKNNFNLTPNDFNYLGYAADVFDDDIVKENAYYINEQIQEEILNFLA